DGFQNLKTFIPTDQKIAILDALSEVGYKTIEVTSFVSPKAVPQMADALEVIKLGYRKMIFFSFPGDEESMGGCLAAGRGFFHINPEGKAEPCPFSPYSDRNVADGGLREALKSPLFMKLRNSGLVGGEHTGGCVLFENEDKVKELLLPAEQ
ncbi:MAG: hypothetical protein LBN71_00105, partial [Tannerella sp.]|nr:hypothetical protein [Tannerella sp.]